MVDAVNEIGSRIMKSLIQIAQDSNRSLTIEEIDAVAGGFPLSATPTLGCKDTPPSTGGGPDTCDWEPVD